MLQTLETLLLFNICMYSAQSRVVVDQALAKNHLKGFEKSKVND